MMVWEPDAQEFFEGYLKQVAALARSQGDESEEIVQGLRAHVESELASEGTGPVSLEALRAVLETLGRPEAVLEAPPAAKRDALNPPPAGNKTAPPLPRKASNQSTGKGCFYAMIALSVLCATLVLIVVVGAVFTYRAAKVKYPPGKSAAETNETSELIRGACISIAEGEEKYRSSGFDKDGDQVSDYGTLKELADMHLIPEDLGDGIAHGCNFVLDLNLSRENGGNAYYILETYPIDKNPSGHFIVEGSNGKSFIREVNEGTGNQPVEKAEPVPVEP